MTQFLLISVCPPISEATASVSSVSELLSSEYFSIAPKNVRSLPIQTSAPAGKREEAPLDRLHLLVSKRLPNVNRGIIALRENPLPVLPVRESAIKQDHGAAVPASEPQVALVPRRLLEPAEIGLGYLHRAAATPANYLLRPIRSAGSDLHA